ncbi:MAG TPA: hypothetical protein VFG99_12215 [Chloroflexia bacterium]|nr:hypothetical protein [Chloroflexia bacterium]
MTCCYTTAYRTQKLLGLAGTQAFIERIQKVLKHQLICFGEETLGLGGQSVGVCRLAWPSAGAPLVRESISLKGRQVSANRVVGKV